MRRNIVAALRVLAPGIMLLLCMATRVQAQTGTLIAELVPYADVRRTIPADTAGRFEACFSLTPDQRAAATDLITAAEADLARAVNTHLRAVRDDANLDQIQASEARVLIRATEIERGLLGELRSILTEQQAKEFGRFERSHRRTLLSARSGFPLPLDIAAFLRKQGADIAPGTELSELFERFDIEQDAAIVREKRATEQYMKAAKAGYDGSEESRKRDQQIRREWDAAVVGLRRAQAKFVQTLMAILPEAERDALVLEIMQKNAADFDPTSASPDRYPVIREVLALGLSEEQRSRVKVILADGRRQVLELARRCVTDQTAYELMDEKDRRSVPTAPSNVFWDKASAVRKTVSAEVLGLLTTRQRAEYDASPVIDPSKASGLNP